MGEDVLVKGGGGEAWGGEEDGDGVCEVDVAEEGVEGELEELF